ncbi:hypothetical protein D3C79_687600 [compost metagenome]
MHLAEHQDGFTGRAAAGDHWQQVEGDVRVATQAQLAGMRRVFGDQLRHQVQALGIDIAGGVAVVAADVVLLGHGAVQQAAGLHEELLDTDVRRQLVAAQVVQVVQFEVVGEHALDEGLKKAPLQAVTKVRAAETQGGVDRQLPLGQLADPRIQGIDEAVGLAQPQRQAHVDMRGQACQHLVHGSVDRTAVRHLGLLWHSLTTLDRACRQNAALTSAKTHKARTWRALLGKRWAYRPDIFLMAPIRSSSEQSAQVPFGGMALMPVMALARMPSRPP